MAEKPAAFQIDSRDNVATALTALPRNSRVAILGDAGGAAEVEAADDVPVGHKIALRDAGVGEDIIKYGVPIGAATAKVSKGGWVHLHCMGSKFDEKSNQLDPVTGTTIGLRY